MTELLISEARELAIAALRNATVDEDIAVAVVDDLIINDSKHYPSHGLQRLSDYLDDITTGCVDPTATPTVKTISPNALVIEANRAFGSVVIPVLVNELRCRASENGIAVASLRSAHHLGRLARIGHAACKGPHPVAIIGFCNFLGGGARMAPLYGTEARLCTNPMLLAIPCGGADPFVLDMSATTVAEGKIRSALLNGSPIPEGWLIDCHGKPCFDPAALYQEPPEATMTPLGWPTAPHKGFGIGLAVELLVGVLAGAGNIVAPELSGNGGLFIALDPSRLGNGSKAATIGEAVLAAATGGGRYPGHASDSTASERAEESILLPDPFVKWLRSASRA